jgi:geranylgeranyl diphosphate synthase type II
MDLKKYLYEQKKLFDEEMERYFAEECDCPAGLKEAMLYSLRAGGKRLRPILAMAACDACGGKVTDAMPVALALEMIHTFSLIHDDLPAMDDDDLRRGQPTSHKKFDEATAILAGDALLAEAFSCLSVPPTPNGEGRGEGVASRYLDVICSIAHATGARGMTGGQMLDLAAEGKKISFDELRTIHKHKTGALISVAVIGGAKAAGAKIERVELLKKYGDAIGLAFQITDDILDVEGTTAELGKPAKSDIENNKATYPSILGIDKSKKLAKEQVDAAYASLATFDSKADPLREIARYILNRKN